MESIIFRIWDEWMKPWYRGYSLSEPAKPSLLQMKSHHNFIPIGQASQKSKGGGRIGADPKLASMCHSCKMMFCTNESLCAVVNPACPRFVSTPAQSQSLRLNR